MINNEVKLKHVVENANADIIITVLISWSTAGTQLHWWGDRFGMSSGTT
jgi:hypothetical protein